MIKKMTAQTKKGFIKAAKDLNYPKILIDRLKIADTEGECIRILASYRKTLK